MDAKINELLRRQSDLESAMIGKPLLNEPGFMQNLLRVMEDLYGKEGHRENCIEARVSRQEDATEEIKDDHKKIKWIAIGWTGAAGVFSGACVWLAEKAFGPK